MKHPSYSDLSRHGWRTVVCPTCSSTSAIASPVRTRTLVGNKARIAAERLACSRSTFKWWHESTTSSDLSDEELHEKMDSTWAGYWNGRECR